MIQENKSGTLATHCDQTLFQPKAFSIDPVSSNSMKSSNPHSGCHETTVARTLDTAAPDHSKNQGGVTILQPIPLENHPSDSRVRILDEPISPTLTAKMGTGGGNVPMILEPTLPAIAYDCRNDKPNVEVSPTIQAKENGGISLNYTPPVFQPIPINDKATRCSGGGDTRKDDGAGNGLGIGQPGDPAPTLTAADRHGVCYCIQGSMIGRKDENGPQGSGINEDVSFTLNTIDRHAVVHETSETFAMQVIGEYIESEVASTCKSRNYKDATDLVVEIPPYIARRYTPLECARLQGFPDWWTDDLGVEEPSPLLVKRWAERLGKTEKRAAAWLKDPGSDASKYKMWGNGIALPCAMFVMEGIVQEYDQEVNERR